MSIPHADCKIREARQRITAIDRAIADLQRAMRGMPTSDPARPDAERELLTLRSDRELAVLQLEELLYLDEMPADEMARA